MLMKSEPVREEEWLAERSFTSSSISCNCHTGRAEVGGTIRVQ